MRIWDIDVGFLNAKSLLGEHRELHGIYSIITKGKTGYSRHPETLRWVSRLSGLAMRHEFIVAEMTLRGFKHHSPLEEDKSSVSWPDLFIDHPADQYRLLQNKYLNKEQGRIPLPKNINELWASHKYSAMARHPAFGKNIGSLVAASEISFDGLAEKLVLILRTSPTQGRLTNALSHMWGYVAKYSEANPQELTNSELLMEIQDHSQKHNIEYLLCSTALGELNPWC
ncbi:MAG: DUF1722 domain-containing protein [Desulfobulbaceae bacterium]|nr:DUF1722 domain-containing protein [Desulfobulbaceae bacterium]